MSKTFTELTFPKTPWLSEEEYDNLLLFGVYQNSPQVQPSKNKNPFTELEARTRYQIYIITNAKIGKFNNGTIADGYLEPGLEDRTAYLTKVQQDALKMAVAGLIQAQLQGWRPYNDLKQSFSTAQGQTNSTIGSFQYATEMEQLPYITQMFLRMLLLDLMLYNPEFKQLVAPEEFVKFTQLVDFNLGITDTDGE